MSASKLKVGIIGIGMVGTPIKKYLQRKGFKRGCDLFCYDADSRKRYNDDVRRADVIFVCVPTPRCSNGSCDIGIVDSVIGQFHKKKNVLVVKSTVEPGTVARLQKKYNCPILFNPEFLTEANAWRDFIKPDRQIVGHTKKSSIHSKAVLGILPQAAFMLPCRNNLQVTSSEAEMGKYACNVFGAIKVSYANIVADFCRILEGALKNENIKERVDYENVRKIMANDSRIGGYWLDVQHSSYRGFGGYCFPKDTAALIAFVKKLEKNLSDTNPNKKLIKNGLNVLKAIWKYNKELLESQGLTVEKVSLHDNELAGKLKNIRTHK